ncbi:hypothetical protein GCM10009804_47200 [Kribbella hippodromi]|uniref:Uncharacterized protein n=1 Tax=Kribbella hippodromi TaxID=434347 RepID=A0ABP4PM42_9ACTN
MLSGRVLRGVISAHLLAIVGQPVFAGVYLSGDFDALRWHAAGANVVTSIAYLQVIVAVVVWVRLRLAWPFTMSLGLAIAETVQYFAGQDGALWLHIPLGVFTIAGVAIQFIRIWQQPLRGLAPQPAEAPEPSQEPADA